MAIAFVFDIDKAIYVASFTLKHLQNDEVRTQLVAGPTHQKGLARKDQSERTWSERRFPPNPWSYTHPLWPSCPFLPGRGIGMAGEESMFLQLEGFLIVNLTPPPEAFLSFHLINTLCEPQSEILW